MSSASSDSDSELKFNNNKCLVSKLHSICRSAHSTYVSVSKFADHHAARGAPTTPRVTLVRSPHRCITLYVCQFAASLTAYKLLFSSFTSKFK